jgi:hypothetical protein
LLKAIPEVMLSDEVPCAWVKTSSEEAAHNQIDKRSRPVIRDQDIVKDDLGKDIQEMPTRETLCAYECGSKGVEENLEGTR